MRPRPAGRNDDKNPTDKLVAMATQRAELFHDQDGTEAEAYATIQMSGFKATWPMKSKSFRNWLIKLSYEKTGKVPGARLLQETLNILHGLAQFDGPEHPVFIRVAGLDGDIWIDLGDDTWQAVRITPHGWKVIDGNDVPVKFIRRRAMKPLPVPVAGGDLNELRPFINTDDGPGFILVVAWLVMTVIATSGEFPCPRRKASRARP